MKKQVETQTATFRSLADLSAMYWAQRRVKKSGLGRIIASRVLTEENVRDSKITITMGAPRRVEADYWLCPFLIRGIVESGIHYAAGSDALQFIIMALAGIRLNLNQTGRQFIWFGDDHGIRRHVPTGYGRTSAQRVDRAIERESKRVQVGWLRTRKAEIAAAEERLKILKKGGYRSKLPEAKADLEAEIVKREAQLKAAKKGAATWEAGLKKWKP